MKRTMFIVFFAALSLLPVRADLRIEERTTGQSGGRTVESRRITLIRGKAMRVEVSEGEARSATIYNLESLTRTTVLPLKREVELKSFQEVQAVADRKSGKEAIQSSIVASGSHSSSAGRACDEYRYSIRVPVTKSDGPVLLVTGTACIARDSSEEYRHFCAEAAKQGLILGLTSDNIVMIALARAQTEQYRLFASAGGMPLITHGDFHFEGGMLASMLNKAGAGTRDSRVEKVSTDALSPDDFDSPAGWKTVRR